MLTATALPEVEKQIVLNLQLRSVLHLSTIPDRRNLRYSVIKVGTEDPSITFHWLVKEIKDKGTLCERVIIFCRTHRHCREIYRMFDSQFKETYGDYKSRPYSMFHAGTEEEVKSYVVNSMTDINGTVRVLVATTAFGKGVDCKGLYLVVHFGPPSDIDDYCQESGRAGRDQKPSHAVLIRYPRCTSGRRLTNKMQYYMNNSETCKRQIILKSFGHGCESTLKKHECCDICTLSCHCSGESCEFAQDKSKYLSYMELNIHSQSDAEECPRNLENTPIVISEEGKCFLKKQLEEYRLNLTKHQSHPFVGYDLSTEFPLCAVKEIIENIDVLIDEKSLWLKTSLLSLEHVTAVNSLITEIRAIFGLSGEAVSETATVTSFPESRVSSSIAKRRKDSDTESSQDSTEHTSSTSTTTEDSQSSDADVFNHVRKRYRANFRLFSDSSSVESDED